MALSFKTCTINDLKLLIEISRTTFEVAFEKHNNPEDFKSYMETAFSKEQIKKELLNYNSTFYFVFKKEVLVGYFKLNEKEAQNEQFDEGSIELERIYVLQKFQGQQIGKVMLQEIISIVKMQGASFLWLGVWENNTDAIRFYERYGFRIFNSHPYYVGADKQTDFLMKLDFV